MVIVSILYRSLWENVFIIVCLPQYSSIIRINKWFQAYIWVATTARWARWTEAAGILPSLISVYGCLNNLRAKLQAFKTVLHKPDRWCHNGCICSFHISYAEAVSFCKDCSERTASSVLIITPASKGRKTAVGKIWERSVASISQGLIISFLFLYNRSWCILQICNF